MEEQVQKIMNLIMASDLDQTIKDILIRDLQTEGLTDFLKEQIKAYCLEDIKKANAQIEEAKKILGQSSENPAA